MLTPRGKKNFLFMLKVAVAISAFSGPARSFAQSPTPGGEFPSWPEVRAVVVSHFQAISDLQAADLITTGDAAPALRDLEAIGWKGASRCDAAARLLSEQSFLARELRSDAGRAFMRRTSGYKLIYDRLDRISQAPGGQTLIHDMIRLPDGYRYAQSTPARGAPSMTDFLPKGVSGKAPRVPDLDKPTGRAYTLADFLTALEASYQEARKAQR